MFKGFKTITFGFFLALVPPALVYLGGVDWQSLGVSPGLAAFLGAVIVALRGMTNTPIFKRS